MRDQLGEQLEGHLKGNVWDRAVQLRGIAEALAEERRKKWLARVAKYDKMSPAELKALYTNASGLGLRIYYADCPICSDKGVVEAESDLVVCTNPDCREAFHSDECLRCDRLILHGVFCEDCQDYVDNQ